MSFLGFLNLHNLITKNISQGPIRDIKAPILNTTRPRTLNLKPQRVNLDELKALIVTLLARGHP